ncbi:MAG: D-alanyl-D-alanine dipeptidase [Rhodospirillales bacterium RIFCSPLOWO2_12_FULL_58_28]|nr:MAG: D-alanyl-D-alanine dipeptidase [Rhodospirillales bacterium RIFCSPLOWO2_02_FULL_58_16]OHC78285.1 MAG: D-alanyl-D-alanine dipeptidase [Rhodospirillales bacterium RIFCSPLOWO2_12_FULL_58_28]
MKPALIEITEKSHGVILEIAYATANNFTGKPVYSRAACYLNPDGERLLARAVKLAAIQGLHLKIFDAFRPSEAQWVLWNHTPDPGFLADPRRGSPHSRGAAVDLTLLDDGGVELDMGTAFDAFTPLSHHGNAEISVEAQRNRFLLLGLMSSAGWDFYRREWWHYQLFDSRRYPVLDNSVLPEGMMRP